MIKPKKKPGAKRGVPRAQPTEKQTAYVEGILSGLSETAAAVATGAHNAGAFKNSATVKQELEVARRWLTDTTQVKRIDTVCGIMDGIEMARMMGDPGNVIKGWSEIGKILGHYAPEKKQIELTINQQGMRSKLEALSDEDLMAMAEGRTIEGEAVRLTQ